MKPAQFRERVKKAAPRQQRRRIRQPAKVFFRVRPLEHCAADEANEAHDEDVEARHWRRCSSHNPGDGGERAVAFLADAPRARAAGRESRRVAGGESRALQSESPTAPQTKPASHLSPARLGQMLAPIALYPDDLLADVLAAATYPLDVVEAARWLQDPQNAALKGDQLFAALQQKSWDPSVKSLALFPRILRMLDANLEWTEQLGEAYLADPAALMDAVQRLRRRAQLAGRLVTTSQEIVRTEQEPTRIEETITIETPSPEVAYVPICDPSFAYGPWPYPDYPPFFPIFAGATIGGCGWITGPIIVPFVLNFRTRHIEIDRKRLALFDRDRDRERDRDHALGEEWRHDPAHRGNVPYRDAAVRALFGERNASGELQSCFPRTLDGPVSCRGSPCGPAAAKVGASRDGGRPTTA